MREPFDDCALCGNSIPWDYPWRDSLSEREYEISGICQACQDQVFDADEHQAANKKPVGQVDRYAEFSDGGGYWKGWTPNLL